MPSTGSSIRPNEIPASPVAASAAPVQSIPAAPPPAERRPGTATRESASAINTSGTLIRKIQRHDAVSTIWPPISGPARIPTPPHAVQVPIAPPRSSAGNTETMIASAAGVSIAPETP